LHVHCDQCAELDKIIATRSTVANCIFHYQAKYDKSVLHDGWTQIWNVMMVKWRYHVTRCQSINLIINSIQTLKGKGKGAVPQWGVGEVLISQTLAVEPVGGW